MQIELPDFSRARVLVIGDVMLDRYMSGDTSRISPEAPVPVVRIRRTEERVGGAGNVALNIRSLGGAATLLGIVGADPEAEVLKNLLVQSGVTCEFSVAPKKATLTKLRILSRHQQLIRLDFEDEFHGECRETLNASFNVAIKNATVVILSDYGKGTLQEVQKFIQMCKEKNLIVLVDPKADFEYYRGATIITPNLKEFEAVVGPCRDEAEIVSKAQTALNQYDLQGLLVTRGSEGMSLIRRGEVPVHLPAKALDVFDVTGAGDTVIATFATCLATGQDPVMAMRIANLAAGIVVSKVGTATASETELQQALNQEKSYLKGLVTEDELLRLVNMARSYGEKIVMTNGCFDILHPGHVAYLEQAKALGHKLIVAVNDDASVKRLKGTERPINKVTDRMKVLSGLESVDWVVPFTEDTPARIIAKILPDVLVKGGDWTVAQIAGADAVLAHGGEVRTLTFVDGHSTTKIIERILSEDV